MTKRNHRSRREAGRSFERSIADHLKEQLGDEDIDRQVKMGSKDKGDIRGVKHMGQRVAVECKNHTKLSLGPWMNEAHKAMGHADAGVGLIVHKRHGKGQPGDQWVTTTVDDLIALITGEPRQLP